MVAQAEQLANVLTEAERAGGKALAELIELPEVGESPVLRELLRKVAHDEGYWARELAAAVRRAGGTPSAAVGDFADKVRAVPDVAGKLALLNRGQRWVVRQIEEHVHAVSDERLRGLLRAMAAAHVANIEIVDRAMDGSTHVAGGDPACWLHLVCESCGAVVTEHDGHRPDCEGR